MSKRVAAWAIASVPIALQIYTTALELGHWGRDNTLVELHILPRLVLGDVTVALMVAWPTALVILGLLGRPHVILLGAIAAAIPIAHTVVWDPFRAPLYVLAASVLLFDRAKAPRAAITALCAGMVALPFVSFGVGRISEGTVVRYGFSALVLLVLAVTTQRVFRLSSGITVSIALIALPTLLRNLVALSFTPICDYTKVRSYFDQFQIHLLCPPTLPSILMSVLLLFFMVGSMVLISARLRKGAGKTILA